MMWNWRMLAASGEAKFADVIERALYNGINSGMSLDGTTYCYRNPLAFNPQANRETGTGEDSQSVVRHDVLPAESGADVRFAAGIFLQHQRRWVYVHLYDNSEMKWHLPGRHSLSCCARSQNTRGRVRLNYPFRPHPLRSSPCLFASRAGRSKTACR